MPVFTIRLSKPMIEKVERYAKERGLTRSKAVAELLERALEKSFD